MLRRMLLRYFCELPSEGRNEILCRSLLTIRMVSEVPLVPFQYQLLYVPPIEFFRTILHRLFVECRIRRIR